ncbi:MAG: alpha/beta hydrolase [Bdellovibrionota bacterium]
MEIVALDGNVRMNVEVHPGVLPLDTLFIHGNLASNRWWHPSLELLKANAKPGTEGRMIMAEWRGCGDTSHVHDEAELQIERLAEDYVNLLREMGVKKACVVGHSTGGLIALVAMAKAPQLFDRAVLLDPVHPGGIAFTPEALRGFTAMSRNRQVCEDALRATIHGVEKENSFFQTLVDDAFSVGQLNWLGVPRTLATTNVEGFVKRVAAPVLVLHGEHDPVLPIDRSRALEAILLHGRFEMLNGQGHSANVENPALFVRHLNEFLFERG